MRKVILIISLCAAVLMCGCGAGESSEAEVSTPESSVADESSQAEAGVDLKAAAESLIKGDGDLTKSVSFDDKIFEQSCKNLYGFEKSELADAVVLYNAGGGKANEVSILLRADGDTDAAIEALTERRDQRYRDFDGYVPEELPKIEAAKIFSVGGYAVMIISEEAVTLEAAVKELLGA